MVRSVRPIRPRGSSAHRSRASRGRERDQRMVVVGPDGESFDGSGRPIEETWCGPDGERFDDHDLI